MYELIINVCKCCVGDLILFFIPLQFIDKLIRNVFSSIYISFGYSQLNVYRYDAIGCILNTNEPMSAVAPCPELESISILLFFFVSNVYIEKIQVQYHAQPFQIWQMTTSHLAVGYARRKQLTIEFIYFIH